MSYGIRLERARIESSSSCSHWHRYMHVGLSVEMMGGAYEWVCGHIQLEGDNGCVLYLPSSKVGLAGRGCYVLLVGEVPILGKAKAFWVRLKAKWMALGPDFQWACLASFAKSKFLSPGPVQKSAVSARVRHWVQTELGMSV